MTNSTRNRSINRWWRGVDQQLILSFAALMALSLILVTTASPSVAERIGLDDTHFLKRQIIFLILACFIVIIFSCFKKKWIRRISILGFIINLIALVLVKIYGFEAKGSTRWIYIAGFSYQPSEFIKPLFAVVTGWLLSIQYEEDFPSFFVCFCMYLLLATLLIIQPDFGMLVLVTAIFVVQLFIAGLPIIWLLSASVMGFVGVVCAYFLIPHVAIRANSFLYQESSENYQISKSILAFEHGGLYGKGPGEGFIKQHIPDSHTDFIFAVAGEEFGAILCAIIIALFAFIVLRTIIRLSYEDDKFIQISAIGIITQFGLQALINIGVTLNLLPTKGMTLPFISYGGSSTLAIALGCGMLLALTKKKTSLIKYKIRF